MKPVTINVLIRYTNEDFSPAERNPFVKCFLDARFHRDAVKVHLEDGKTHRVTVSGVLRDSYRITHSTALCFASVAWRANESGNPCMLDTGVAHVTLSEISEGIKASGRFVRDMPLVMHTAERLCKASIEISIDRLDVDVPPPPISASVAGSRASADYINATLQMEQRMRETFGPQTANMRIPYDYSESGIQSSATGVPLPAVAYVLSEVPRTNDHYWENAFTTIMARDDLTTGDWKRLNLQGKARASIHMVCYIAQYLDYIGDTVDTNRRSQGPYNPQRVKPYENFGDGIGLVAGDCEDLGTANLQATNAFIDHVFDPSGPLYDELIEAQGIVRRYVPPLSLDVVRGQQVKDSVASYGAHMNDNYIPIDMFEEWSGVGPAKRRSPVGRSLPPAKRGGESDRLPFLVGEGTGMYECLGVENPLLPIMTYIYSIPSLEGFKKPITHRAGEPGNFFVGSLVGLTDYYYRRGLASAPMSFWYVTREGMTRGASYEDMMNHPERVGIVMHPPVSRELMAEMKEQTLRRLPPEPLVLSPLAKDAKRRHYSPLDHIVRSIDALNRPPGNPHHYAPVYVRPHNLQMPLARQIAADLTAKQRVWKVEYRLEEITDSIYGYAVRVFVN